MQHIVIVEDDPIQIKILQMIFSAGNYQFSIYAHAEELMKHLDDIVADVFLLDLALPDMDGFVLCKLIRLVPRFRHIPIIAVSADVNLQTISKTEVIGFTDLIEKPIRINEFLKTIDSYFLPL